MNLLLLFVIQVLLAGVHGFESPSSRRAIHHQEKQSRFRDQATKRKSFSYQMVPEQRRAVLNRGLVDRFSVAKSRIDAVSEGPSLKETLVSASSLIFMDVAFRRLFMQAAISFPSSLAGCGALFVSMLALPFGGNLFKLLSPGAALLAKWLPVFFVPSLVTLPLAGGLGSSVEVGLTNNSLEL